MDSRFLKHVYANSVTRILLKPFVRPWFSRLSGKFLSSKVSKILIPHFIKSHQIDMTDYVDENYDSFNAFFVRRVADGARTVSRRADDLISPCDGEITVYPVTREFCFEVKGSIYDLQSFTQSEEIAEKYSDGTCLVIRLYPKDYHRYHFIDNGTQSDSKYIQGVFHTVQPIAERFFRIYMENSRVVTLLHTENFGNVCQVEVGALLVGKIVNEAVTTFRKGQEKGHFEYGGSTIVLLFEKDRIRIKKALLEASESGIGTRIKMGEVIGEKTCIFS